MKRQRALFGQVHNEPTFFPIWLKYYSQFYDPSDIYVIHLTKPKPVEFDDWLAAQTGFVRVPMPDVQICDFQAVVDRAKKLQRELLERHECVLFAEVDEFLAHRDGLGNYIDRFLASGRDVEVCSGWEIVHRFDGELQEPPLDLSRPILPQRRWWYHCHLYDKPLLSRIPLDWVFGFHYCSQVPWETTNQNLLLLHLNKVDYDICHQRRLARIQNEDNSELVKEHPVGSAGWQHWISEFDVKNWFRLNLDTFQPADHLEIPEDIKRIPL